MGYFALHFYNKHKAGKKRSSRVLQDGVVLLKSFLSLEEQQHIIDFCIKFYEGKVDGAKGYFAPEVN